MSEVDFYEPEDVSVWCSVLHNIVTGEGENRRDVTPPNPFIFLYIFSCTTRRGNGWRRGVPAVVATHLGIGDDDDDHSELCDGHHLMNNGLPITYNESRHDRRAHGKLIIHIMFNYAIHKRTVCVQ